MPETSIIMPNYNCALFIREAIDSVLAQAYTDWELIIVDDASSDDSAAIIEQYVQNEPRIRLIRSTQNQGAAACRNQAVAAANGHYIAFLDSDDFWYPDKLQIQISYMKTHAADICYMSYFIIDEQGKILNTVTPPARMTYDAMLKGKRINTLTAVMTRSVFPGLPALKVLEDTAMWLKLFKSGHVGHGVLQPLSCYRLRQRSLSSNKWHMGCEFWRLLRDQEKIPLMLRCWYFSFYALTMLKKYMTIIPHIFRFRT